jgi:hypothetical protein
MSGHTFKRRTILRGILQGTALSVGLPVLDVMLNGNGTALASGAPLPLRFGTWFWGCGMNPERWNPQVEGEDYEITPELQAIAQLKGDISVFSGFNVPLDGRPNQVHHSGVIGTVTGNAPGAPDEFSSPSLDILIADAMGAGTRFRSLEIAADGDPRHSYSRRSTSTVNAAEVAPLELYKRVFGADFQDPNAGEWAPDPRVLLRQSVLSAVRDDRQRLMQQVGAHDRERLDAYFSSVRQVEQQLEIMLRQPEPLASCSIPEAPGAAPAGSEIELVMSNHRIMSQLLAMSLACNQTRVFNVVFSKGASQLRLAGSNTTHHQLTHEEPVDSALGYQPQATYFVERSMEAWADFVGILKSVPEGDGCLLDNCLVLAHSETALAKTHDVFGLPIMVAGKAGGKVRAGVHVRGNGDPVTRVGLTLQQIMGVQVERWGSGSLETNRPVTDMLV